MKASMILASGAALFTSALAAPAIARSEPLFFGVQITDDQSGKNINRAVLVGTDAVTLGQVFGDFFGPQVIATSMQAITPSVGGNNVRCEIKNPNHPGQDFVLNAWNTYIDLDGNSNTAMATDVTHFTIKCTV